MGSTVSHGMPREATGGFGSSRDLVDGDASFGCLVALWLGACQWKCELELQKPDDHVRAVSRMRNASEVKCVRFMVLSLLDDDKASLTRSERRILLASSSFPCLSG